MAAPPPVAAPRVDPVKLPVDLQCGDTYDLEPGAMLEGFAFDGLRLDEFSLRDAHLELCRLTEVSAPETELRGASFVEVVIERLDVPVLRGSRASLRDVRIEGGRLGSAELYDSEWRSVHVVGCKLGFVNLRGASLHDVIFTECTIDELDLGSADARRVTLPGTRIRHLDVTHATLADVDLRGCELEELTGAGSLRGAVVDPDQLALLAPILASELGIRVE
ncbi:pentapeptide repeat-containing protein [Protaetiibacter sp. SSC-01]|uniref:pentapeptide repeat-containing protein n=1 Tax=Protaetiibacter sp. SSC-01 TaxID=2759943 RepID=UPI001657595E|nr:pentapeptide repeat-containing protein [Protaetiibacter sp. SSC-01]QNO37235.1 pentapeptide repeat-containing protein [Protaetiibacter sp. SSC-01]